MKAGGDICAGTGRGLGSGIVVRPVGRCVWQEVWWTGTGLEGREPCGVPHDSLIC